jgi:hypothetical protein
VTEAFKQAQYEQPVDEKMEAVKPEEQQDNPQRRGKDRFKILLVIDKVQHKETKNNQCQQYFDHIPRFPNIIHCLPLFHIYSI